HRIARSVPGCMARRRDGCRSSGEEGPPISPKQPGTARNSAKQPEQPERAPSNTGPAQERSLIVATANERSQAVHRDSIVIDTLADGPFFIDAELEAETDRLLDAGAPPAAVIQHLSRRFREKIVREPETRELYRQKWQEAGVTVVSETQGGFGSPPFGYEAAIEAIAGTTAVLDACRDFL